MTRVQAYWTGLIIGCVVGLFCAWVVLGAPL